MTENEREEAPESSDALTIFPLLVRCPNGGLPNDSCPFAQHRDQYTLEEKFSLAKSIPQNKRREMLAFHKHCQARNHVKMNTASSD